MTKLFALMFITIILLGSVSAFEFDNVGRYDVAEKTITVQNAFGFGSEIATVKLETELKRTIYNLDEHIAEFNIFNHKGYDNFLSKIESFEEVDGGDVLNLDYRYEYLNEEIGTHTEIEVGDAFYDNGTRYDESYPVEVKGTWVDFDKNERLPSGKIRVRMYFNSDVKVDQEIEVIPTFFGERIDEWFLVKLAENFDDETPAAGGSQLNIESALSVSAHQIFAPQTSQIIHTVELPLIRSGGTPTGVIYGFIFNATVLPGYPGNQTPVATFNNITASSITATTGIEARADRTNFTFNGNNASLKAGVNYSIALFGESAEPIRIQWIFSAGSSYSGGRTIVQVGKGTGFVTTGPLRSLLFRTWELTNDTFPIVTTIFPANNSNFTTSSIDHNATVSDDRNVSKVEFYVNSVLNQTNQSAGVFNNSAFLFNVALADGTHTLQINATDNNTLGEQSTVGNLIYVNIDTINPSVTNFTINNTVNSSVKIIGFHESDVNTIAFRWNVSDIHLNACRILFNFSNRTETCSLNTTVAIQNITDRTVTNATFYVNDTFGLSTSNFMTWDYYVWANNDSFNNVSVEGSTERFSIDIFTGNGTNLSSALLWYNNTALAGLITELGGGRYNVTRSNPAETVTATNNIDVFWSFNLNNGIQINSTTKTQQVTNIGIDDCSVNTDVLYNFTIADEGNKTLLPGSTQNTTGRVNLQVFSYATTDLIQSFNQSYFQTNTFSVCLNDNLASGQRYSHDVEIQYEALGYSSEFRYIQNETLDNSDFPTNITLLDLILSEAQIFKIIFKDSSFLPLEDALINISRKYIDEGVFRVTEIPKTDGRGETVASLVVNDVVYKIEVIKFGETLATFNDVIAVCQIPGVVECEINLNAFSDNIVVPDFEQGEDFNFTLGYNNNTRLITSVWNIPSGTLATISLNVTQEDALGTSICADILTSTSGTLTCNVTNNFGNATVIAKLYKNANLQAQGQIKLDQNPVDIYGVSLAFLALFVMITLIGAGVSDNPVFTVLFFMVGVIFLFGLNLVANNGFIGATATILWLILAVIIVVIKGANRN